MEQPSHHHQLLAFRAILTLDAAGRILTANDSACMLFGLNETELRSGQRNIDQYVGRAWTALSANTRGRPQHLPVRATTAPAIDSTNIFSVCSPASENPVSSSLSTKRSPPDYHATKSRIYMKNEYESKTTDDSLSPDYVVIDLAGDKSTQAESANPLVEYYVESKDVLGLPINSRRLGVHKTVVANVKVPKIVNIHNNDNSNVQSLPNAQGENFPFKHILKDCVSETSCNFLFKTMLIDLHTSKGQIKTLFWAKPLVNSVSDINIHRRKTRSQRKSSIDPLNRNSAHKVSSIEKRAMSKDETKALQNECNSGSSTQRFLAVFEPIDSVCADIVVDGKGCVMEYSPEVEQFFPVHQNKSLRTYDNNRETTRKLNDEDSVYSSGSSIDSSGQSKYVGMNVSCLLNNLTDVRTSQESYNDDKIEASKDYNLPLYYSIDKHYPVIDPSNYTNIYPRLRGSDYTSDSCSHGDDYITSASAPASILSDASLADSTVSVLGVRSCGGLLLVDGYGNIRHYNEAFVRDVLGYGNTLTGKHISIVLPRIAHESSVCWQRENSTHPLQQIDADHHHIQADAAVQNEKLYARSASCCTEEQCDSSLLDEDCEEFSMLLDDLSENNVRVVGSESFSQYVKCSGSSIQGEDMTRDGDQRFSSDIGLHNKASVKNGCRLSRDLTIASMSSYENVSFEKDVIESSASVSQTTDAVSLEPSKVIYDSYSNPSIGKSISIPISLDYSSSCRNDIFEQSANQSQYENVQPRSEPIDECEKRSLQHGLEYTIYDDNSRQIIYDEPGTADCYSQKDRDPISCDYNLYLREQQRMSSENIATGLADPTEDFELKEGCFAGYGMHQNGSQMGVVYQVEPVVVLDELLYGIWIQLDSTSLQTSPSIECIIDAKVPCSSSDSVRVSTQNFVMRDNQEPSNESIIFQGHNKFVETGAVPYSVSSLDRVSLNTHSRTSNEANIRSLSRKNRLLNEGNLSLGKVIMETCERNRKQVMEVSSRKKIKTKNKTSIKDLTHSSLKVGHKVHIGESMKKNPLNYAEQPLNEFPHSRNIKSSGSTALSAKSVGRCDRSSDSYSTSSNYDTRGGSLRSSRMAPTDGYDQRTLQYENNSSFLPICSRHTIQNLANDFRIDGSNCETCQDISDDTSCSIDDSKAESTMQVAKRKHHSGVGESTRRQAAGISEVSAAVVGEYSDQYTLLQEIGRGAFGSVRLSYRNSDGLLAITKLIPKSCVGRGNWVTVGPGGKRLPLEVALLTSLNHPNIVSVLSVFDNREYVQLVMEKFGAGLDLFEFIERDPVLDDPLAAHIFAQLTSALIHLRSSGILHRDVKDENIIINEHFHIKLIDFGSATYARTDGKMFSQFAGTVEYCSPEVLQGNKYLGPELEIWSMGVTLYTLMVGQNPYHNIEQTIHKDPIIPEHLSVGVRDLIINMLQKNSTKRYTLDQIAEHEWTRQPCDPDQYRFAEVILCSDDEINPHYYVNAEELYAEEDECCLSTTSDSFAYQSQPFDSVHRHCLSDGCPPLQTSSTLLYRDNPLIGDSHSTLTTESSSSCSSSTCSLHNDTYDETTDRKARKESSSSSAVPRDCSECNSESSFSPDSSTSHNIIVAESLNDLSSARCSSNDVLDNPKCIIESPIKKRKPNKHKQYRKRSSKWRSNDGLYDTGTILRAAGKYVKQRPTNHDTEKCVNSHRKEENSQTAVTRVYGRDRNKVTVDVKDCDNIIHPQPEPARRIKLHSISRNEKRKQCSRGRAGHRRSHSKNFLNEREYFGSAIGESGNSIVSCNWPVEEDSSSDSISESTDCTTSGASLISETCFEPTVDKFCKVVNTLNTDRQRTESNNSTSSTSSSSSNQISTSIDSKTSGDSTDTLENSPEIITVKRASTPDLQNLSSDDPNKSTSGFADVMTSPESCSSDFMLREESDPEGSGYVDTSVGDTSHAEDDTTEFTSEDLPPPLELLDLDGSFDSNNGVQPASSFLLGPCENSIPTDLQHHSLITMTRSYDYSGSQILNNDQCQDKQFASLDDSRCDFMSTTDQINKPLVASEMAPRVAQPSHVLDDQAQHLGKFKSYSSECITENYDENMLISVEHHPDIKLKSNNLNGLLYTNAIPYDSNITSSSANNSLDVCVGSFGDIRLNNDSNHIFTSAAKEAQINDDNFKTVSQINSVEQAVSNDMHGVDNPNFALHTVQKKWKPASLLVDLNFPENQRHPSSTGASNVHDHRAFSAFHQIKECLRPFSNIDNDRLVGEAESEHFASNYMGETNGTENYFNRSYENAYSQQSNFLSNPEPVPKSIEELSYDETNYQGDPYSDKSPNKFLRHTGSPNTLSQRGHPSKQVPDLIAMTNLLRRMSAGDMSTGVTSETGSSYHKELRLDSDKYGNKDYSFKDHRISGVRTVLNSVNDGNTTVEIPNSSDNSTNYRDVKSKNNYLGTEKPTHNTIYSSHSLPMNAKTSVSNYATNSVIKRNIESNDGVQRKKPNDITKLLNTIIPKVELLHPDDVKWLYGDTSLAKKNLRDIKQQISHEKLNFPQNRIGRYANDKERLVNARAAKLDSQSLLNVSMLAGTSSMPGYVDKKELIRRYSSVISNNMISKDKVANKLDSNSCDTSEYSRVPFSNKSKFHGVSACSLQNIPTQIPGTPNSYINPKSRFAFDGKMDLTQESLSSKLKTTKNRDISTGKYQSMRNINNSDESYIRAQQPKRENLRNRLSLDGSHLSPVTNLVDNVKDSTSHYQKSSSHLIKATELQVSSLPNRAAEVEIHYQPPIYASTKRSEISSKPIRTDIKPNSISEFPYQVSNDSKGKINSHIQNSIERSLIYRKNDNKNSYQSTSNFSEDKNNVSSTRGAANVTADSTVSGLGSKQVTPSLRASFHYLTYPTNTAPKNTTNYNNESEQISVDYLPPYYTNDHHNTSVDIPIFTERPCLVHPNRPQFFMNTTSDEIVLPIYETTTSSAVTSEAELYSENRVSHQIYPVAVNNTLPRNFSKNITFADDTIYSKTTLPAQTPTSKTKQVNRKMQHELTVNLVRNNTWSNQKRREK